MSVLEVHGLTDKVTLEQHGHYVTLDAKITPPKLTAAECRYLARKLYRMARLIETAHPDPTSDLTPRLSQKGPSHD